jgi:hypothetical protein
LDKIFKGKAMTNNSVVLWSPQEVAIIPSGATSPTALVEYAIQLTSRDKTQIIKGFQSGSYEMTMSYVWTKSMAALKRELGQVGMGFIGELLGRNNLSEESSPTTSISDEEAIMLARQLGVVTATEGLRLRHAHEQITHFVDREGNDIDDAEEMEEIEAISGLNTCVKNILGKQKVEVATQFADFRSALETRQFKATDNEIQTLIISPYFFKKITLGILLNLTRSTKGAQLENSLANLNIILPLIWPHIRDAEKWLVGNTYSKAYSDGAQTASAGLKSALLKVKGFDYVPENIRSHTFIKVAEKIIEAHEATNNFYNEPAPVRELRALGTTIPIPAFPSCAAAILCVKLGNPYGVCTAAQSDTNHILDSFSVERWNFYLNECLPSDARILDKLLYEKPRNRFFDLVEKFGFANLTLDAKSAKLIEAAASRNETRFAKALDQVRKAFYGKD